jgi:hypothetical protein
MWREQAHPFGTLKPLKWIQLKSHTARFQQSVQDSLKYVADVDKNVVKTINEYEAFDETDCVRGVIQIKTEDWNIKSMLDLGKKSGVMSLVFLRGKVKLFLLKMYCYLLNCFDPSGNKCRVWKLLSCH